MTQLLVSLRQLLLHTCTYYSYLNILEHTCLLMNIDVPICTSMYMLSHTFLLAAMQHVFAQHITDSGI
jgi:hypothetical protein